MASYQDLNRFKVGLLGEQVLGGGGTPVEVWTTGIKHRMVPEGSSKEFAGGYRNDRGLFRYAYDIPLLPIALEEDGYSGIDTYAHDHKLWLSVCTNVLAKRYKQITSVTGMDVAGTIAATQFWAQMIAAGKGHFKLTGIEYDYPDDGTVLITLNCEARYRGLTL